MPLDLAVRQLALADPVLGGLIARVGPCRFEPDGSTSPFEALVRSIVYQQLSGQAAGTIYGRLHDLFGGRAPTPAELLATADEPLRAVGLSRPKIGYLRDLAGRVEAGELDLLALEALDDEAVIARVAAVRGIGRWTAQMVLMFRMGRPDVLPELDLGIQKAIWRAYGLPALPKPKEVLAIGERWAPHRTIASWYLWRSLELPRD